LLHNSRSRIRLGWPVVLLQWPYDRGWLADLLRQLLRAVCRAMTENRLQSDIVRELRKMGLMVVAIPNGGKRRPREARQLKNRGVVAGFPDIQVMRPNKRVDLLELKTGDGKLSDKQFDLHAKLTSMGFAVHVVRSVDEAVKVFG